MGFTMRKVFEWIGIRLGVVIVLLVVVIASLAPVGNQKLTNSQQYHVAARALSLAKACPSAGSWRPT